MYTNKFREKPMYIRILFLNIYFKYNTTSPSKNMFPNYDSFIFLRIGFHFPQY